MATTTHTPQKTIRRAGRTFLIIPQSHIPAVVPGARFQPRGWKSYTFAEVIDGEQGPLAFAMMDTVRETEAIIRAYVADPKTCAFVR